MSNPPNDQQPSTNGTYNRFSQSAPQQQQQRQQGEEQNGGQLKYERPKLLKTMSNPGRIDTRAQQRPPFRRGQSIRDKISTETHKFFGVPMPMTPDLESPPSRLEYLNTQFEADQKWQRRRFRHLKNSYGVKTQPVVEQLSKRSPVATDIEIPDLLPSPGIQIRDPFARSVRSLGGSRIGDTRSFGGGGGRLERRDSVAKMAYSTLSNILQGKGFSKPRRRGEEEEAPQKYKSIRERNQLDGAISFQKSPDFKSSRLFDDMLDPALIDLTRDYSKPSEIPTPRFVPESQKRLQVAGTIDSQQHDFAGLAAFPTDEKLDEKIVRTRAPTETSKHTTHTADQRRIGLRKALIDKENKQHTSGPTIAKLRSAIENATHRSWRESSWWQEIFNPKQPPRRKNLPIFGKMKGAKSRDRFVIKQLANDESDDYRPFFTYWVTTVQIIITLFSVFYYGIGTDFSNLFGVIERSGDVFASTLSTLHIVVWEQNNVWIGPRFPDLVHIGAKYTPCMRADTRIYQQIDKERQIEASQTGCCIGSDGKCFQTSDCPKQFATFSKWKQIGGQKQPIVCGQDPRFCDSPYISDSAYNDTSKWPKCQHYSPIIPRRERHMHCEISGRPCCIQMHGQCRITTKEYCDFVSGYYHANATLCSQVSCLNDVCGMTPFLRTDTPDQFYRFFLPLFIHAGLLRLLITCALQLTIMRRFELMIGCVRLGLIYFVSGVGGYLASASFVPYMPEVGPAGSQGGVLGALIINVIYNWNYIKQPFWSLMLHLLMALFLFLTGLLPYIDNWAQVFGFLFGILMAAALIPYFDFGKGTRFLIVATSLLTTILLFAFLLVLFYGLPVIDSQLLSLLNCPLPESKICDQQGLILKNWLPI